MNNGMFELRAGYSFVTNLFRFLIENCTNFDRSVQHIPVFETAVSSYHMINSYIIMTPPKSTLLTSNNTCSVVMNCDIGY